MVKIPSFFDLIMPGANPSRREFLGKSVKSVTESQPANMDAIQLLRYIRENPRGGGRESAEHTAYALYKALMEGHGLPATPNFPRLAGELPTEADRRADLLHAWQYGGTQYGGSRFKQPPTPEQTEQLLKLVEEVLPRFRQYYQDISENLLVRMMTPNEKFDY